MIKTVSDYQEVLDIIDRLKEVETCRLEPSILYAYITYGMDKKDNQSYVTYKNDKMAGCFGLKVDKTVTGYLTLYVMFLWIDPHYPRLWLEYMKFIEEKAKEFKVQKISFTTGRKAEGIERKLGKYNYRGTFTVFEKEMII